MNTIRQSDTPGKLTTGRKTQEEGTEKTQGKHFKTKQETRDRKRQDKTQHRQIVTHTAGCSTGHLKNIHSGSGKYNVCLSLFSETV